MKINLVILLIIAGLLAGCTPWQVRTETPTPEPAGITVVLSESKAYSFDSKLTLEVGEFWSDCSEGSVLTAFLVSGETATGHTFCVITGSVVEVSGYWIKVRDAAIVESEQTLTLEIAETGCEIQKGANCDD